MSKWARSLRKGNMTPGEVIDNLYLLEKKSGLEGCEFWGLPMGYSIKRLMEAGLEREAIMALADEALRVIESAGYQEANV